MGIIKGISEISSQTTFLCVIIVPKYLHDDSVSIYYSYIMTMLLILGYI
jgi:hypothetical protein